MYTIPMYTSGQQGNHQNYILKEVLNLTKKTFIIYMYQMYCKIVGFGNHEFGKNVIL